MPRMRTVMQLLLLSWPLLALPALAAPVACGTYRGTGHDFVVENATQARTEGGGLSAPTRALLRQQGNLLHVADISNGHVTQYTVSDEGRQLETGLGRLTLVEPAACTAPAPASPASSCRADIAGCIRQSGSASTPQLRQWCGEDLPFACSQLLSNYLAQAGGMPDTPPKPPECEEGTPEFNADACRAAANAVLGMALAAIFGSDAAAVLPDTQLEELRVLCRAHPDGYFCAKVADAHWNAGHYLPARDALHLACTPGGHAQACEQADALAAITATDLAAASPTILPCGDYAASAGLLDQLTFADAGQVVLPMSNAPLRARLEGGMVRIRHDKGGDFVLKPLSGGRLLLGVDDWNRYALYRRTGGSSTCSAPVGFVEIPLPQDCPLGSDPQACCDAGKLQGCNALGHSKALVGDWPGAIPHYRRLCEAGVRAGCENLRSAYENTGEESIPQTLHGICAHDGKGTHVACDVEATTDWAMLALGTALMRAIEEIDIAPGDEAAKPEPAGSKSLRK